MAAKREFLTTNEVAQILGISPFTVRRYIQTRKLKAVKLEGSYRVRQSHLDDFVHAREIETEEELAALEQADDTEPPPKPVAPIAKKRTPLSRQAAASVEKRRPPPHPFRNKSKKKPRASTRRKEKEED